MGNNICDFLLDSLDDKLVQKGQLSRDIVYFRGANSFLGVGSKFFKNLPVFRREVTNGKVLLKVYPFSLIKWYGYHSGRSICLFF